MTESGLQAGSNKPSLSACYADRSVSTVTSGGQPKRTAGLTMPTPRVARANIDAFHGEAMGFKYKAIRTQHPRHSYSDATGGSQAQETSPRHLVLRSIRRLRHRAASSYSVGDGTGVRVADE